LIASRTMKAQYLIEGRRTKPYLKIQKMTGLNCGGGDVLQAGLSVPAVTVGFMKDKRERHDPTEQDTAVA